MGHGEFNQPPTFSFKPEEWEEYLATFESFRVCSKLYKDPKEEQICALKYTMGNTEAEKKSSKRLNLKAS